VHTANNHNKGHLPFRLKIINAKGIYFFLPEEIIRLEARDNYTHIYCEGYPLFIASRVLKEYEDLLAPHGFVRIHRSHIVNKFFVKKIESGAAILLDETKLGISRRKKVKAVQALKNSVL
jgi:two-component system LytT family response regulator